MITKKCFCDSNNKFSDCCEPFITGIQKAPTALALMRSRYAAYAVHEVDYLWKTTHISQRKNYSKGEISNWAISNQWLKLEIINATEHTVEFKAYFFDSKLQNQIHHELSTFKLENENWFYVEGEFFNSL